MLRCRSFVSLSLLGRRTLSSGQQLTGTVSLVDEAPRHKGKFQHWRRPVYVSPHSNPLDVGPDFSFTDGRPVYFTSQKQLDGKKEQIRLGKKIVSLLADISKMEVIHEETERRKEEESAEKQRVTPRQKGTQSIL